VNDSEPSNYTNSLCELNSNGKTTVSVLLDAQFLLNNLSNNRSGWHLYPLTFFGAAR